MQNTKNKVTIQYNNAIYDFMPSALNSWLTCSKIKRDGTNVNVLNLASGTLNKHTLIWNDFV